MFGFFVAGASLIGLIALARSRRRYYGRGYFGSWALRRLDTSPGQEKVIRTAISDAQTILGGLRDDNRAAREELASILGEEKLDEARLGAWFEGREGAWGEVKPKLVELGRQVHEVLDADQKKRVGSWLRSGFGRFGHHRHHHGFGHHGYGCGYQGHAC